MNGRTARVAKCSLLAALTAVGLFGCDLFTPGPDFTPINLSDNEGRSESPRVACGPAGNTVVVWHDLTNKNQQDVWLREKPLGGEWLDAVNITDNPGDSRFADVCFDSTGVLHLVWQQRAEGNWSIVYKQRSRVGNWGDVETVGGTWTARPRMTVDRNLNPVVVFKDGLTGASVLLCGRRDAGKWAVQQLAALHSPDAADVCPLTGDSLLAVWTTFDPESLYYSVCDEAGLWTEPEKVCDRWVASVQTPEVWFDGETTSILFALWDVGDLRLATQVLADSWTAPAICLPSMTPGTFEMGGVAGKTGPVVVVTDRSSEVRVYSLGRSWRLQAAMSSDEPRTLHMYPAIAVRFDGVASVVWEQTPRNGVPDIFYTEVRVTR